MAAQKRESVNIWSAASSYAESGAGGGADVGKHGGGGVECAVAAEGFAIAETGQYSM